MQTSPVVSLSSSFSGTDLAEIAARVVEEFTAENEPESEFCFIDNENHENQVNEENDDFEFAFVTAGSEDFSPISADEIFYNGQIRPIFNRDLLLNESDCNSEKVSVSVSIPPIAKSIRVSLRKLFIEDREIASSSSSSSEVDDLEGITPGTYCVWRPKSEKETPISELSKKSNSTGSSSKRWKLRDYLHRSNSDNNETFLFLATPFKNREEKVEKKTRTDSAKITGKVTGGTVVESFPAVRCSKNGKDTRKSYAVQARLGELYW